MAVSAHTLHDIFVLKIYLWRFFVSLIFIDAACVQTTSGFLPVFMVQWILIDITEDELVLISTHFKRACLYLYKLMQADNSPTVSPIRCWCCPPASGEAQTVSPGRRLVLQCKFPVTEVCFSGCGFEFQMKTSSLWHYAVYWWEQ